MYTLIRHTICESLIKELLFLFIVILFSIYVKPYLDPAKNRR